MRRRRSGPHSRMLAAALASSAILLAGCDSDEAPRQDSGHAATVGDAGEPAPAFDGDAAFQLLERQVEFGPRVPNTPGHLRQLEWMTAYLRERSDTVALQEFEHTTVDGEELSLTNVFARFAPERPDRILLLAHWDTRPTADQASDTELRDQPIPGANDGASGVAVLLRLADVLSRHSPPLGVDILLVDGEDYGPEADDMYLGAKHFAANPPPGYRPLYGVLLDMVADRDPRFRVEGYSRQFAPEVVDRVWRTAEELGWGDIFVREEGPSIQDDHVPLNRAGIRTIDIIDFEYGPGNRYWHTPSDDLERVAPLGLQAVGDVLTTLIFRGG